MKYLLVIDDRQIRKDAFSQAAKLLKKIDRFETDLESFHDQDQKLFSSWFDLTFREEQKQILELREQFRLLAVFNNQIIAVADTYDISSSEAFFLLRKEEAAYREGSEQVRAQIDEVRKSREERIKEMIAEEYGPEPSEEFAEPSEETKEESEPKSKPLSEADAAILPEIAAMSDQRIRQICADRNGCFELLNLIIELMRSTEDEALLVRVWELAPAKNKKFFAKAFLKQLKVPFEYMIERIRARLEQKERLGDDGFDEEFINPESGEFNSYKRPTGPEAAERIKLLYRKLVRQLHPDLQAEKDRSSIWQKKIWNRVQSAYKRQDQHDLEKLFRLVLIRNRELNHLTVGEILESQIWLKEEIKLLNHDVEGLKNLPAWGFSRRKNYEPLKRKLAKPFVKEIFDISEQIGALNIQHALWEASGPLAVTNRQRPRRGKTRRRRRKY